MLHGHAFAVHARSTAEHEDWRADEDGLNARESLEHLVDDASHPFMLKAGLDTWQKRLMYFLKPVARHFGVDDEALLQRYLRHNLPTHMVEAGLDPIPFLEAVKA
jgi:hypothetical protein